MYLLIMGSLAQGDRDAFKLLCVGCDSACIEMQPPLRLQTFEDTVDFRRYAMPMCIPVGPDMTQEGPSLRVRERHPTLLRNGAKGVNYCPPANTQRRCGIDLVTNQA